MFKSLCSYPDLQAGNKQLMRQSYQTYEKKLSILHNCN